MGKRRLTGTLWVLRKCVIARLEPPMSFLIWDGEESREVGVEKECTLGNKVPKVFPHYEMTEGGNSIWDCLTRTW